MALAKEDIMNRLRKAIGKELQIGSSEEIIKGKKDFQKWGTGLLTGSRDWIIDQIATKLVAMGASSLSCEPTHDYEWQKSKLEGFCIRIQALIPGDVLAGYYVGRIGEDEYSVFGCRIMEDIIQNQRSDKDDLNDSLHNEAVLTRLKVLVAVALADGHIDVKERAILEDFCRQFGLDPAQLSSLMAGQMTVDPNRLPKSRHDKCSLLVDVIRMAAANGRVEDSERHILGKIAKSLGLDRDDIKECTTKAAWIAKGHPEGPTKASQNELEAGSAKVQPIQHSPLLPSEVSRDTAIISPDRPEPPVVGGVVTAIDDTKKIVIQDESGQTKGRPTINTKMTYFYRDATNRLEFNTVIVMGIVTAFIPAVQRCLKNGKFIPGQVGLEELQPRLLGFPRSDDHIWHELDVVEATEEMPTLSMTCEQILAKFQLAARDGWDTVKAMRRLGLNSGITQPAEVEPSMVQSAGLPSVTTDAASPPSATKPSPQNVETRVMKENSGKEDGKSVPALSEVQIQKENTQAGFLRRLFNRRRERKVQTASPDISSKVVSKSSKKSGTALFWFDSQEMSDSGHGEYGKYAYQKLLPFFSPGGRKETRTELYFFFDGDCQARNAAPHNADAECLQRLEQTRLPYVILVSGEGYVDYSTVNRCLRKEAISGYIGMSTRDGIEAVDPTGLSMIMRRMSLAPALTMKLGRLRKDDFHYLSDENLVSMGFKLL